MTIIMEIKKVLEDKNFDKLKLDLKAMPQKEAVVFLTALNQLDKLLIKLDPTWLKLSKDDLKRLSIAYLLLHDLYHAENANAQVADFNDLSKLEILTTAPIFSQVEEVIGNSFQNLSIAYFLLGISALKINHALPHLISEKIILGEFVAVGGLENGIWGVRIKNEILPQVALNVLEKTKKDSHHLLVKKYKDLAFDFL